MPLDFRAQPRDRGGFDVGNLQHAVRIAHRDGADVVFVTIDVQRIPMLPALGDKGDTRRVKFRVAHADGNLCVVDASFDGTGRAQQAECPRVAAFPRKQAGDAAHAVAALLDL